MTMRSILPAAVTALSLSSPSMAASVDDVVDATTKAANAVSSFAQPDYTAMAAIDVGGRNHVDVMLRASGLTKQTGSDFVGYYGEYTSYDDTTIFSGGIKMFNYTSKGFSGQTFGTYGSFGLSLTSYDKADYDRFGGEVAFGVLVPIVGEQLHIDTGVTVRPTFLSSEADSNATAEYGYKLGLTYRLTHQIATYGQYASEGVMDDEFSTENLDNAFSIGVRLTF